MLERVELTNFQCHKSLALDLDRITTLVGASDSGKTTVLRALDWVCFNRGRTALLLRRGESNMTVKLKVDGTQITRTTKQNSYWINDQQLSTIGKTQPPEISNIMRMVEENVQRQHDYLFWFSCNGSGLVQQLNRVVDLTELDGWVREGVGRERRSKEKIESYVEERREKTDKRDGLLLNRDADTELKVLEEFSVRYEATKTKYDELTRLMSELASAESEQAKLSAFVGDLTRVLSVADEVCVASEKRNKLSGIVNTIQTATEESTALSGMLNDWEKTSDSWDALQVVVSRENVLSGMVNSVNELTLTEDKQRGFVAAIGEIVRSAGEIGELRKRHDALTAQLAIVNTPVPDLAPLKSRYEECVEMMNRYNALMDLAGKYTTVTEEANKQAENVEGIRAEFEEKLGGICPICGGKMNDGCINE